MKQELRSAFAGSRFWIALAALLLCFLGFSLPEWIVRCGQGDRMYLSSFNQGFAPIFFGGAILLFPFLATLPHALSQVEEIRTGFLFTKAIRTSAMRYALVKIAAVALSGAAAMGLASLLHSAIWNIVAGVYDPIARPNIEVFFTEGTVYDTLKSTSYAWAAFVHAALGFALTGAVWAVVGLATAVWIPDILLTITVPVALYFFWTYQFAFYLLGVKLPDTSALYNDGQYWPAYFQAVAAYAAVFLVAAGVYYGGLQRRLRHA
jgi:hypothetical protein